MDVLVTGGAGYIGSVVSTYLIRHGVTTRVLDGLHFGGESLLGLLGMPHFDFMAGDLRNAQCVMNALRDAPEAVIHLAAIVGDPACKQQPEQAREINETATGQLIDLCKHYGVQRFIFISTCSNYGISESNQPVTEDSPLNPISLYAETKVKMEQYLLQQADATFHPCILRLSTVFGLSPRMRFDLLVNELTRDAVLRKKIVVYGVQFWRPYLHVQDVAKAISMVLQAPLETIDRQVFNVGMNTANYQKQQIIELVLKYLPETEIEQVEQRQDPRNYRVAFDKIGRRLGFYPDWTVEAGIFQIKCAVEQRIFRDPFAPIYHNSL